MSELERQLIRVGAETEWPETPPLRLPALPAQQGRSLRRPLLVALAVAILAVAVAAAVPGARSSILHLFRIGGASVERVQTLPAAQQQALSAGLGRPVGAGEAELALGAGARLPRARLVRRDGIVSAVLQTATGPVLFSALRTQNAPALFKKLASTSTNVEFVAVATDSMGIWIAGARHVVIFPAAPPRLAGNVLLWELGGNTYRLEGSRLERDDALALARNIIRH